MLKFRDLLLMSLLIVFVTACETAGDFCLSASYIPIKDSTIDYIVKNDTDLTRSILSHNAYGQEVCGWP